MKSKAAFEAWKNECIDSLDYHIKRLEAELRSLKKQYIKGGVSMHHLLMIEEDLAELETQVDDILTYEYEHYMADKAS